MTTSIPAVFRDGAFYPTSPVELPNGTSVRLTVDTPSPDLPVPDPAAVVSRIQATIAKAKASGKETGQVEYTARDHDKILYGSPDGVR